METPVFFPAERGLTMAAKLRKREEIPAQYKWDLSHIYPDDAAWEAALADVLASGKKFAAWEGKVAENPRQAIREYFDLNQQAEPVFSYAFLRGETDNGDPVAQGLRARASQMGVQLSTAMSFFEPELLSLDDALLAEIAADPAMADYDAFLRNLIRQKPHTLPAEQEKLLAMMGQVAQAPNHIFGMLTDVDMSFPPVQMPDGTTAELTEGTYSQFIRSDSRDVRKSAFDGIMNTYGSFGSTIAATYNGSVQNDVFQARARHYATARDARMEPLEIPTSVYDNLISEVHAAIPVLNEYLALRKALMGLDELIAFTVNQRSNRHEAIVGHGAGDARAGDHGDIREVREVRRLREGLELLGVVVALIDRLDHDALFSTDSRVEMIGNRFNRSAVDTGQRMPEFHRAHILIFRHSRNDHSRQDECKRHHERNDAFHGVILLLYRQGFLPWDTG